MSSIADLVTRFSEHERPTGIVLPPDVMTSQAIAAVLKYSGYGDIESRTIEQIDPDTSLPIPLPIIDETCNLNNAEWAIIRPLFLLYVERENAIYLEASRSLGLEVYGRSVSEISGDITQLEMDLPHLAFSQPIITV